MLDSCRHFQTKDFIKRYIDLLAYHKMNIFHWHLTEDEAWRIEIKKYPKLTEIGAWPGDKESGFGGYWGPELKAAGFDGIIVEGAAKAPVYLWLHDGECEIRDARPWWGKLADEVQHGLEAEIGDPKVRVLQTGIAGEKGVRYAALVNQQRHFHGRSGLGAVMGAKNLKAIVCRGRQRLRPARPQAFKDVLRWWREHYDQNEDRRHVYGTAGGVPQLEADGILPTRNFRDGSFEHADAISGQRMSETILTKAGTCFACAVACKREVEVPERGVTPEYGGPEYETIAALGSLQGIGDLRYIAEANAKLANYVLDSISTGATVAFAMECFEAGLLTTADTDGLELRFGNQEAAMQMIDRIARREGLGDLLAEGVMRAAAQIGGGAEQFAMHVKGQELPMHEPRGKRSLGLAYATSPTGADHMEAPHDPFYTAFNPSGDHFLAELGMLASVDPLDMGARKVRAYHYSQLVWSLYDTLGMCDFVGVPIGVLTLTKLVETTAAITGWDTSLFELLKCAERGNALKRVFNIREGFTPADDCLPQRLHGPLGNGALEGVGIDPDEFAAMLHTYYDMAGWDRETGMPTPARLAELDLDWVSEPSGSPA